MLGIYYISYESSKTIFPYELKNVLCRSSRFSTRSFGGTEVGFHELLTSDLSTDNVCHAEGKRMDSGSSSKVAELTNC